MENNVAINRRFFDVSQQEESNLTPTKKASGNKFKSLLKNPKYKYPILIGSAALVTLIVSIFLFWGGSDSAVSSDTKFVVSQISGRVSYENEASNGFVLVEDDNLEITPGTTVRTGTDGTAIIYFDKENLIVLEPGSEVEINASTGAFKVAQLSGVAWYNFNGSEGNTFSVQTVNSTIETTIATFATVLDSSKDVKLIVKKGSIEATKCNSEDVVTAFENQIVEITKSDEDLCESFTVDLMTEVTASDWYKKFDAIEKVLVATRLKELATLLDFATQVKADLLNDATFSSLASATFELTLVLAPPKITITEPIDGYESKAGTVMVKGLVSGGKSSGLKINGIDVALTGENGNFEKEITLKKGDNLIKFEATNKVSKEKSEVEITVKFGSAIPEADDFKISLSGIQTASGIELEWDHTSIEGIVYKGFKVLRGDQVNPGAASTPLEDVSVDKDVSSYTFNLNDGKTYHFMVCVFDGTTCTKYSNNVTIKAPGTPTSFP